MIVLNFELVDGSTHCVKLHKNNYLEVTIQTIREEEFILLLANEVVPFDGFHFGEGTVINTSYIMSIDIEYEEVM